MSALHTRTPGPALGAMADTSLPFARNVVGAWHFDEGAGLQIIDSGLYGNHGTLIGGAKRAADPGVEFDGITGHASIPHSPLLTPSRITVILRARNLVTPAQYDCLLIKSTDGSWNDGYGIWFDGASLLKFYVTDSDSGGIAQITVNPVAWNTIVATYDGTTARVFANGAEGTAMNYAGGISLNNGPLEFGRGRDNAYNLNGVLAYVSILNVALDAESARAASL